MALLMQDCDIEQITLEIIVKSEIGNTLFCYLGIQRETNRIYRPIPLYDDSFAIKGTKFNWNIGDSYTFIQGGANGLKLPHAKDDLPFIALELVTERIRGSPPHSIKPCLLKMAKSDFSQNKYEDENTDCPSVYIKKCLSCNITFYQKKDKLRIVFRIPSKTATSPIYIPFEVHDLPYTAQDTPTFEFPEDEVVVILSMGRPYEGTQKEKFNPRRCYLLVVGLM